MRSLENRRLNFLWFVIFSFLSGFCVLLIQLGIAHSLIYELLSRISLILDHMCKALSIQKNQIDHHNTIDHYSLHNHYMDHMDQFRLGSDKLRFLLGKAPTLL